MKSRRTREERQVTARRIFEALCEHYPDRYIALVERPGSIEPTPTADSATATAGAQPWSNYLLHDVTWGTVQYRQEPHD